MSVLDADAGLLADRPGLLLLADKHYVSGKLDDHLRHWGAQLLRLCHRNRTPHPCEALL